MSTIAILHEGEWKAARIVGYGMGGSLHSAILNETYVTMTVSGNSFAPRVELISGSTATIRWVDMTTGQQLAVGPAPSINWGSGASHTVGLRVDSGTTPRFDDVRVLNFGFNHNEDSGAYNIGASYDYTSQPITGIANLQLLPNLRYFLAAGTPLTGHLNASGLSHLEHIECFMAHVQSIDLAGCTSLIRLCLEANSLSNLDLNPVSGNLYDLRAAVQNSPSLTFATLSSPMAHLYHYCIRDQTVHNIIPHAQLPVIEEYWAWGTDQTISDAPTSPLLRSYASYGNAYDQTSVDAILTSLALLITDGAWHSVDLSGGTSASPSASGWAAVQTLRDNGWTVTVNGTAPPQEPTAETLLGEWLFADSLADTSGNGRTAVAEIRDSGTTWTPTYTDGPLEGTRAIEFTADELDVRYGRTGLEPTTNGFTTMAWAWAPADYPTGEAFAIIGKTRFSGSTRSCITYGSPLWVVTRWADNLNYGNLTPDPRGAWHHFAVVDGPTTARVYVDGALLQEWSRSAPDSTGAWDDFPWRTGWLDGGLALGPAGPRVSMVRIFDGELTQAQIASWMNTTS